MPFNQARLVSHAEYVRTIRGALSDDAFKPNPTRVLTLGVHIATILGLSAATRFTTSTALMFLFALAIGHAMACITFHAHDTSHGSVIRTKWIRYPVEALSWAFVYMPATVWKRVHGVHHAHTQTLRDCDRLILERERSFETVLFTLSYPHKRNFRFSPFIYLHFWLYAFGNTATALLYGLNPKRPESAYIVSYKKREIAFITLEITVIAALHAGIFQLMGAKWLPFLICNVFAYALASMLLVGYIFTNHAINPLMESVDPVVGTLSIRVPKWISALHNHFPCHTEHHLFPALDSRYYPMVTKALQEYFPDRYNTLSFGRAWRELHERPTYDANTLLSDSHLRAYETDSAEVDSGTSTPTALRQLLGR